MSLYLGIDLGTTNSVASIAREGNYGNLEVETLKITQIGEDGVTPIDQQLLPSVLYVEYGEPFIGEYAKTMKTQKRKNIIANSKNFVGENKKWEIDGKEYTPQIVASYILKGIRKHVEEVYRDRIDLTSAVITVPASFDLDQKTATKEAAKLAGFDASKITLISEPTAALLDFINEQRKFKDDSKYIDFSSGKKVLVFDLGGGTCDVSIIDVKMVGDKVSLDEIAVSPHTLVGGVNFDNYAVEGIIRSFNKKNGVNLEKILTKEEYEDLRNNLCIRCEKAKMFFSGRYMIYKQRENATEALNNLSFSIAIPNAISGKAFQYELKFNEYNKFISPLLQSSDCGVKNIIDPILDTIKEAKITTDEIDYVFCVGGMTMYPAIADVVKSILNKEPLTVMDRMCSVSNGASVFNHYKISLSERENECNKEEIIQNNFNVIPSMPQSVFLNVKNGFPITLIEAGTKAGTPLVYRDLIKSTSEVSAELELYAGKTFFDPNLKKLKKITLEFPRGVEKDEGITLKIEYTVEGMLTFDAWVTKDENMRIGVNLDEATYSTEKLKSIQREYKLDNMKGVL